MNRKILLVLIFICFMQNIYSEESTKLYEASFRFTTPDSIFLNFVIGRHFPVMPNIISPGISADIGIGLDWLKLFSDDENNKEENKANGKDYDQFGCNLGFRIYNLTEIGIVTINTFIGYNLILGRPDKDIPSITHNPMIGASIVIKLVGIEYSYYIPTIFSNNISFHHLAIVFHLKR